MLSEGNSHYNIEFCRTYFYGFVEFMQIRGVKNFKIIKMNHLEKSKGKIENVLWLTDTYGDHNGVSMVLQAMHREIKARNLPIDIMVCSDSLKSDDHLIVLKPVLQFGIPYYRQQPLRIPNYLSLRKIFKKKKYDRVLCSTEGPMGFAAIYFKKFHSVKTYFYLHTDWLMFAKQVMGIQENGLNRIQYLMRRYYKMFDFVFVLNSDQQKWLTGTSMQFHPSRVLLTAHWTENIFVNLPAYDAVYTGTNKQAKVILYVGRLCAEKGIFELPGIFRKAKEKMTGLKMLIAGTGPYEAELKAAFPEAKYTGWIDHNILPEIYGSADLLLLPSRFDTFSCVVLEALSCGVPVIAYNTKGPKDIIQNSKNGFLVETPEEMSDRILEYFSDAEMRSTFPGAAAARAKDYTSDKILKKLLSDIEIDLSEKVYELS